MQGMHAALEKSGDYMGSRFLTISKAKERAGPRSTPPLLPRTHTHLVPSVPVHFAVSLRCRHLSVSAASGRPQPKNCTTLFVKNVPYSTDEDSVLEFFSSFGDVENVRLARWNHTQQLKGFGYVQFAHPSTANKAFRVAEKRGLTVRYRRAGTCNGFAPSPASHLLSGAP